jgi:hypothetical protein
LARQIGDEILAKFRPDPVEVGERLRLLRFAFGHRQQTSMVNLSGLSRDHPALEQLGAGTERPDSLPGPPISMKTKVTLDWIYWGERGNLTVSMAELLDGTVIPPTTRS